MKKITKLLSLLFVLIGVGILTVIISNNVSADELTDDEVLLEANFSQETISSLSSFTKEKIATQIKTSRGFDYNIGTLAENANQSCNLRSVISSSKMTFIATSSVTKVEGTELKEITVRIYYEWNDLPLWRLEDPIITSWTNDTYSYKEGSLHTEDHYISGSTDNTFKSSSSYLQKNQNTICWLADLKGYSLTSNCKSLYGFGEFILIPKQASRHFAIGTLSTTYIHSISVQATEYALGTETGYEITNYSDIDYSSLSTNLTWQTPITMSGSDYGFTSTYSSTEETKEHSFNNSILITSFTTKRLRCAYIDSSYVIISAIQRNAGTAYLEYQFIEPVYEIIVDLAYYSSSEFITTSTAEAALQYKNSSGNWVTLINFFEDVTLPTDRTAPTTFTFMFPANVRQFRFYTSSTNAIGTRPKGRICIGDIKIFGEL